jgi:hypothetical protein
MAWNSSTSWSASDTPAMYQVLNNIGLDIRTWGGNVDGGGYELDNIQGTRFIPGALPGTTYTVASATWSAATATVTIGTHFIAVGQLVTISGINPSGFNASSVKVTAVTATTISYSVAVNPGTYVSGGSVLVGTAPTAGMVAIDPNMTVLMYNGSSWQAATTTSPPGVWRAGSGAPSSGLGNNGDMYLNVSTGDVYGPKTAGSWGGIIVNLKGPQGQAAVWWTGSGAPSSGLGNNGDMYLDTSTGNVYGPKTSGAWGSIRVNITGPQGPQGNVGPQGPPGVAYTPRGNWNSGTTYAQGDEVTYNSVLYISLQSSNLGHQPDINPSWWQQVAPAGLQDPGANGIVKRTALNTTAIAVAGTDYAPATSGTSILKANGSGGFANAAAGTDYAPATSGTSILKGNGAGGFANAVSGTDYAAGTHASQHKHGGSDEVATATPAPNAIPKADSTGKLNSGWLPSAGTGQSVIGGYFRNDYSSASFSNIAMGGPFSSVYIDASGAYVPYLNTNSIPMPAAGTITKFYVYAIISNPVTVNMVKNGSTALGTAITASGTGTYSATFSFNNTFAAGDTISFYISSGSGTMILAWSALIVWS